MGLAFKGSWVSAVYSRFAQFCSQSGITCHRSFLLKHLCVCEGCSLALDCAERRRVFHGSCTVLANLGSGDFWAVVSRSGVFGLLHLQALLGLSLLAVVECCWLLVCLVHSAMNGSSREEALALPMAARFCSLVYSFTAKQGPRMSDAHVEGLGLTLRAIQTARLLQTAAGLLLGLCLPPRCSASCGCLPGAVEVQVICLDLDSAREFYF